MSLKINIHKKINDYNNPFDYSDIVSSCFKNMKGDFNNLINDLGFTIKSRKSVNSCYQFIMEKNNKRYKLIVYEDLLDDYFDDSSNPDIIYDILDMGLIKI